MAKFKIKAISTEYFDEEIEANSLEEAKQKFEEKWENGDIESECELCYEDEGEFSLEE